MTRCLEYIEPFGPHNEPMYVRIPITTVISFIKKDNPELTDQQCIDEFKAVHWAHEVEDPRNLVTAWGDLG